MTGLCQFRHSLNLSYDAFEPRLDVPCRCGNARLETRLFDILLITQTIAPVLCESRERSMNIQVGQAFERGSLSTTDPSEFEMAVQPWDLLIDNRSPSRRKFELDWVSFPGLSVLREGYNQDVRMIGMPPPDQLVLAIPFGGDGESIAHGEQVIAQQLYSLAGDPLDVRYRRGLTVLMVEMSLEQCFEPSLALAVEQLVSRGRQSAFAQSRQRMRALSHRLTKLFEPETAKLAMSAQGSADLLRETLEDAITGAVLPESSDAIHGRKAGQKAAVTAALDYLRTPGTNCTSVVALCLGAGVNKRTLERGVRDQFDCTVVHLLQKWRMHAARQSLLETGPRDTTVTSVATSLGFFDLGRFASRYRHHFGEYPSETLASATRTIVRRNHISASRRSTH